MHQLATLGRTPNHGIATCSRHARRLTVCRAQQPKGKCWLVGAGLGSEEYLTLKAVRLLQSADVVVYDDLGTQDALAYVPPTCEKLYVGKRGGSPESRKQKDIDRLLVDLCTKGRNVVRLKGGCVSVFSRLNSELAALRAAGVEAELVPGISSALASPVLAGFPLTDAQVGGSFAVVSGHNLDIDWSAFRGIPTLVVLMGGRNLPFIVQYLLADGWGVDTPVVIVRAAGTKEQRVWRSTLGMVVSDTDGQALSPAVVIVGAAAGTYSPPPSSDVAA